MKGKWIFAAGAAALMAAGLGAAMKGDPAKGKEVFEDNCVVCHNADTPDRKVGPSLKALYKHGKLHNGKPVNDASVRAMLNTGGNGMPSYQDLLSEQDKDNVIAYLKTL